MKSLLLIFVFCSVFLLGAEAAEPISPIPEPPVQDGRKVALGKKLFHDPILSGDGLISCATCHPLNRGGVDGLVVSVGIQGQKGQVNAPTVYNSGLFFAQFWDGRAESLEEQALGPVSNPIEMGASWPKVVRRLKNNTHYQDAFTELYPDQVTQENVVDAIAAFERSLMTVDGRFDRYLKGEKAAISQTEKQGYHLFKAYGCSSCHQGAAVGGNMFQKMGIAKEFFENRKRLTKADLGRFNVTGDEFNKHEFKVPSLRNVALTGPYLHDGSVKTLEKMVAVMGVYQLGQEIPPKDVIQIVAFLKTLTGKMLEAQ